VLLDPPGNDETAAHVEKALESCGVEVHRATVEGLLAVVDPDHYMLIVPCSAAALDALAVLPDDDHRRIRAVLPPGAALSAVSTIAGGSVTTETPSSVLCLYAHGKLSLCFPADSELVVAAKRALDAMQWHGLARVTGQRGPEGSIRLTGIRAGLDKAILQAGVSFPHALWSIARGEAAVAPGSA